ncbi:hypothetical protein ATANTOWER_031773 [Ataeniobius toweri]|uniref:C-C motif chemokine n=1 Tax=Ataeniobius toweri TaxID=208326 RepID=A0ABU7BNH6_9TELE|nr:hypothetical protein [Ataeniobius toweri]
MEPVLLHIHIHVRRSSIKRDSESCRQTDNLAGPASKPERQQTNMVMMKSPFILATCLLLLSSLVLQTYAYTFGPEECCFKFIPRPLPTKRVVSFRRTESLCPMEGVLFTMKNGSELCADTSQQWVKDIIKDKERNQNKGVSNSNTTASQ